MFEEYKDENSTPYLELVKFINMKKGTIINHIELLLTRYNIIKENTQEKYHLLLNAIENRLSRVALLNNETYIKIDKVFDEIDNKDRRFNFLDGNEKIISLLKTNFNEQRKKKKNAL